MNPHQKNKIDVGKMSEEEQRLFRLYGKLPNRKDLLQNKLKERKYFDSGDYALSKAGKASDVGVTTIGREHPVPENIPHASTPTAGQGVGIPTNGAALQQLSSNTSVNSQTQHSHSPVKESRLQRETSADDVDGEEEQYEDAEEEADQK